MKNINNKGYSSSSFVKVKWIDGMRFVATDSGGHSIIMDASKQSGGESSGFSPLKLLLVGLGGFTGTDVVWIMQKQRQKIEGLEISVSGERVKEFPRIYDRIYIKYRIKGENIQEKAVQRAVQLSEDKYCSVGAMLKAKADITSSYVIE